MQVMKLLIMQSFPASQHFLPLRSKYSPQHSVSPSHIREFNAFTSTESSFQRLLTILLNHPPPDI
jgi:hypothetical protein